MPNAYAQIAFTPGVRAQQVRHGSAAAYDRVLNAEQDSGSLLTPREATFIEARDGVVQASVSETGWPYVQFRGGAPGFLRVIDPQTIAYADYRGNKQYISTGNLQNDDRVSILAIDYARRQRLKLLGRVRFSEDRQIIAYLNPPGSPKAERAVVIRIEAFDWNCQQHIPVRMTDAEYGGELRRLYDRIAELEEQRFATA